MKNFIAILAFCALCDTVSATTETPDSVGTALTLGEVTVKGERPLIRNTDGAMSVDLRAIVSGKPVTNVLESLSYLPGAMMQNGQLTLSGAAGLTIIINGEVQNMPLENLYQRLASIPVERLKSVEIMYSAPARYHVKGTAINIILRSPSALDGLQGQAKAGYEWNRYPSYTGGISAMYATGRWAFDLNYSISERKTHDREQAESHHTVNGILHDISEDNPRIGRKLVNGIYASTNYKFNENSRLQLSYNGQISSRARTESLTEGTLGTSVNDYDYTRPTQFHNISAIYKGNGGLELRADYTLYDERRNQQLFNNRESAPAVSSENSQNIRRWNLYADRTHEIGDWTLNYGLEYRNATDRSRQTYSSPGQEEFDGEMKEHTAQAYVGTSKSFAWGMSLSASAAVEYYRYADEDNWNFIPQFGISYRKTPASMFFLNFTSKRIYPSYWETHGGISYLNGYSIIVGNPDLKPYMQYSAQFTYVLRQKYMATLFYHHKDRYSVQLPYQSPDELTLIFQTINFNYNSKAGLHLHIPFSAGDRFSSTLSIQSFYEHAKASHFHALSFDCKKLTAYASLSATLRLTERNPLSLTVDANYISPSLQGPATISALWRTDAGLKWSLASGKAEFVLRYDDIFNSWSPTVKTRFQTQDYRMKIRDMSRQLNLTFVWRFNGFKPKETDIDTSRFGTGR